MLHEEFFPVVVKKQLADEFHKLKQGQMTIDQYVSRFYQLARHTPRLVPTGQDRAKKFLKGIRDKIQSHINLSLMAHSKKRS